MSRMLLDFSDDELSDCSIGDSWTESTSTDSFYAHDLLGEELFTIWEMESYCSDDEDADEHGQVQAEDYFSGDDDIASIESMEDNNFSPQKSDEEKENTNENKVVVSKLPIDIDLSRSPQPQDDNNDDDQSIDSAAGIEERWHLDKDGNAMKSPFQDKSAERESKRKEIQRKMRVLEQRISVMRGIVDDDEKEENNNEKSTPTPPQKQERTSRPGRRRQRERERSPGRGRNTERGRDTERGRKNDGDSSPTKDGEKQREQRRHRHHHRRKHRSLSPQRKATDRSVSPPRSIVFNDSLENRRKQVALAREKLHFRNMNTGGRSYKQYAMDKAAEAEDADAAAAAAEEAAAAESGGGKGGRGGRNMTNPRHLARQKHKRMNPNRIPSRCRTA